MTVEESQEDLETDESGEEEELEVPASGIPESEKDAEIARLRKEAAGRRVSNKEKDAQLAEFEQWKLSQMTELERANARVAELEKDAKASEHSKLQRKVARAVELDLGLADRIVGETEAEMLEDAKTLLKKTGKAGTKTGGVTTKPQIGKPVGTGKKENLNSEDWLREVLNSPSVFRGDV